MKNAILRENELVSSFSATDSPAFTIRWENNYSYTFLNIVRKTLTKGMGNGVPEDYI